MNPGAAVIAHLATPNEKYWGLLERIDTAGLVIRAISLNSFDDWMMGVAKGEEALGLVTMFFPMHRVVRLFADEPVGPVESYRERFARSVGRTVEEHLGLAHPEAGSVS